MYERFYKEQQIVDPNSELINLEDIFLPLDSGAWKRPRVISLENLDGALKIVVNNEIIRTEKIEYKTDDNILSIPFSDQNINITTPPNPDASIVKTVISVDENYLYVWVPQVKKWKRIPLANF